MKWSPRLSFSSFRLHPFQKDRKPACKPGSVPPVAATAIYLACWLPSRSSSLPESHNGPDQPCSLIWPCSRWGLPSQPVARLLVGSYIKGPRSPHRFTLTEKAYGLSGGLLSVALSRSFARVRTRTRTVGVTHHCVLWSPDFPLPGRNRAATIRPTRGPFISIGTRRRRAGDRSG